MPGKKGDKADKDATKDSTSKDTAQKEKKKSAPTEGGIEKKPGGGPGRKAT